MTPLVLRHGVAATVFEVTLIAWGAGEMYTWMRNRVRAPARSDPTVFLMALAIAVGVTVALDLASHARAAGISGGRAWPAVAGLLIVAAGTGLRAWSIVTLGRYFTYEVNVQEGQRVIEDGPYRVLRHPSYAGFLVGLAGVGLALDNWLALATIVLVPLAAILVRIRAEEAALGRELGDAYRSYSARTHRLVPGIW